jgi:hypothetical protein
MHTLLDREAVGELSMYSDYLMYYWGSGCDCTAADKRYCPISETSGPVAGPN